MENLKGIKGIIFDYGGTIDSHGHLAYLTVVFHLQTIESHRSIADVGDAQGCIEKGDDVIENCHE